MARIGLGLLQLSVLCGVACRDAGPASGGAAPGGVVPAPPLAAALDVPPSRTPLRDIPAGTYRPFFRGKDEAAEVPVAAFALEEHPVTKGQFLRFVQANPRWRRSLARSVVVDDKYLRDWPGDLQIPDGSAHEPVTNVSWFAARAYAAWIGRRLPRLVEWEYAAAASETAPDGAREPAFNQRILAWYSRPGGPALAKVRSTYRNVYGVWDLHGLCWEWVADFNSSLVTGESRGDTGLERSLFCGSGSIGTADPSDYAAFMRFAYRSSLEARFTTQNLGFRCVADQQVAKPSCCEEQPAGEPLAGASVYHLGAAWSDQDGRQLRLASLRGKPVLMAMMFTSCEYACPALLADLKALLEKLGPARGRFRVVLVSFDSARDLPERLSRYALEQGLDPQLWTLLHGAPGAVRELAAVLGVRYKAVPKIGFSHSNIIHLLDAEGLVHKQLKGLGADPQAMAEAVTALLARQGR